MATTNAKLLILPEQHFRRLPYDIVEAFRNELNRSWLPESEDLSSEELPSLGQRKDLELVEGKNLDFDWEMKDFFITKFLVLAK